MTTAPGFKDWKGNPISKERHGGTTAAMFVYFMVVMTSMAYVPNTMNVVTYLRGHMHLDIASASTTVTNFIGSTSMFSLIGAFLSDSFITRFTTIIIFGPLELLGFALLALQAHYPSLQPTKCEAAAQESNCKQVHGYRAALLYIGLYTIAMAQGSLLSALTPFGGDQFDDEDPVERRQKSSYFNWYTFGISLGALIGLIFVVWLENNKGWDYGFGLSAAAVLLGVLVIASGFPLYRNLNPSGSPLTRILQVFIAAFRKRRLILPENPEMLWKDQTSEDTEILPHSKDFTFLDKAAIYYGQTGSWSLCTVSQVEETKIILRMLPIFISSTVSYIPIPLIITLTIQQGNTMNTKLWITRIPPASLFIIPVIFQLLFLVIYDRFFVPFARKITGHLSGITSLQRVGTGFFSTILGACVAALVEMKRRNVAVDSSLLKSGTTLLPMSVIWLSVQFLIIGIIDVTSFVGLLEFFNMEVSRGMKSVGTAIFWCAMGLASLLGSFVVNATNRASRHGDRKMGWLDGNNLNESYLDRFYWLLAALGSVAFLNYLYWARRYVYRQSPLAAAL